MYKIKKKPKKYGNKNKNEQFFFLKKDQKKSKARKSTKTFYNVKIK